jgi:LuxR family transcriptional regulator, maltose regulon positive regulatory protein
MAVAVHRGAPSGSGLGRLLPDARFLVPRPPPGAASRGNLIEAAQSSGCRLVAVTASAGCGKPTFPAQWADPDDRRVAWVSLDRFDDDPAMPPCWWRWHRSAGRSWRPP